MSDHYYIDELDVVRFRGWAEGTHMPSQRPQRVYPGTKGTVVFATDDIESVLVEVITDDGWGSVLAYAPRHELEGVVWSVPRRDAA